LHSNCTYFQLTSPSARNIIDFKRLPNTERKILFSSKPGTFDFQRKLNLCFSFKSGTLPSQFCLPQYHNCTWMLGNMFAEPNSYPLK